MSDDKLAKDDLEYVMQELDPNYGGKDDGSTAPKAMPDIPAQSAIVKTQKQASYLARKMVGGRVPDECVFSCISCGKKRTYKFDEDELAAIPERDPRRYPEIGGKCLDCGAEALVPFEALENGDDFQSAIASNRAARKEEFQDAARVMVDTVKEEFFGGAGKPAPATQPSGEPPTGPGDDLPDAADVDTSKVGSRETK